jgi:hypothetical protein
MEEKKQNKVWIGDDGIVYAEVKRAVVEQDAYILLMEVKKILQQVSGKAKILIDITTDSVIRSSAFRKRVADEIMDIAKNIGFEKTAIYGGTVTTRAIASFIMIASRQKNMKVFASKKEALKWLKKP